MISFEDVAYEYDSGTRALSGATVEFHSSEVTAIVGPNGSGKSTLAKLMTGLLMPTAGRILIDEVDTRYTSPRLIRSLVGLAWQNPDNQLVCGVVEDDIAFGPENLGLRVHEIHRRVDEVTDRLQLESIRASSVRSLSSAQKQLVAVAGAMAIEPRYLVLDEVTSRLDPGAAHMLLEAVTGWARDHDAGVVMITHLMSEVLRAHKVCRLEQQPDNGGRIARTGAPDEVLRDEKLAEGVSLKTPLYDTVYRLDQLGVRLPELPETVDDLVDLLCR